MLTSVAADPWQALAGMVGTVPTAGGIVSAAGAADAADADHAVFEGDSMANEIRLHRDAVANLIRSAKRANEDAIYAPPHTFSVGDTVFVENERPPYWIKRVGFDLYLQELRVVKVGESDSFSAGRWIHHSNLLLLEIGDSVEVLTAFEEASERRCTLSAGTRFIFGGYDADDDVILEPHPKCTASFRCEIFYDDLKHMTLL